MELQKMAERIAAGPGKRAKAIVQEIDDKWGLSVSEAEVLDALEAVRKNGQPHTVNVSGKPVTFSVLHGTVQVRTQGFPALAIG